MPPHSHGSGQFSFDQFAQIGRGVVIEPGVLVFHPENIEIGDDVYIGHNTILKSYYKNKMIIGSGSWIGQQCFLHSGGGITIGRNVGIGPGVKIVTSSHILDDLDKPILHSAIRFALVTIGDDSDVGVGAIILPGVCIGRGVQIGAGAVVTRNFKDYAIIAGAPAKLVRMRN
jgi:acetyltransferase-like isoleucine patch superfamily enzyme